MTDVWDKMMTVLWVVAAIALVVVAVHLVAPVLVI